MSLLSLWDSKHSVLLVDGVPAARMQGDTLELLDSNGMQPDIVEYLKTPPDADTVSDLLDMLGLEPRELMRRKEKENEESGADNPDLTREQLIDLMVRFPRLIERPIVVSDGRAALGRPPEQVLEIL